MKIKVENTECIENTKKFNLKHIAKQGIIFGIVIAGGRLYTSLATNDTNNDNTKDISISASSLEVSSDDINNMNIIINDNNCSDAFFQGVCDQLEEDGIRFTTARENEGINVDSSVVVTLDQQYSSGVSTFIFAPYDNTRIGYSDSLALSMQAAFVQNGYMADKIIAGRTGFKQDENGNIITTIPTSTETDIDANYDTSFVTISLGTQNLSPQDTAKSIENGLARQCYYMKNHDSNTDLLYRASSGEKTNMIAEYFNSSTNDLNSCNNINGSEISTTQIVINPEVKSIDSFSKDTVFEINGEKTLTH